MVRYSMRYTEKSKGSSAKAQELIINIRGKDLKLLEWIAERPPHQRIVLDITELKGDLSKEYLATVIDKNPNIAVRGLFGHMKKYIDVLKELDISFFFSDFVDSWDKLTGFISLGVSDVLIANEFGFSLGRISRLCKEMGVYVRVIPNIAQSNCRAGKINDCEKFFIRPEDLNEFYYDLVDVVEFWGEDNMQGLYIDIYSRGTFNDNLKLLILGLEADVYNAQFLPYFGAARVDCGKSCAYDKTRCTVCQRTVDISTLLFNEGLKVEKQKNYSQLTKEQKIESLIELGIIKKELEEEIGE